MVSMLFSCLEEPFEGRFNRGIKFFPIFSVEYCMIVTRYVRILFLLMFFGIGLGYAQIPVKIAKLKYNGGGDWYANKTALPNLITFCNRELGMNLAAEEDVVEAGSRDIF